MKSRGSRASYADSHHLQDDPDKLTGWSEKWQILFDLGNVKYIYTGLVNEDVYYTMVL